jgi:hypothetical protein
MNNLKMRPFVTARDITTWGSRNERCHIETEEDPPPKEATAQDEHMLQNGEAIPLAPR